MASPLNLKLGVIGTGVVAVSGIATAAYLTTGDTIADKLKKDNLNLISTDEDYKIVLFTNKDIDDLKKAIFQTNIEYTNHINEIKDWCEKKTKEWFTKEDKLFLNAKEWCTVPTVKTLGDKIGRKLHKEGTWDDKFKEIAAKDDIGVKFLSALNVGVATAQALTKNSENAGGKFEKWCNSGLNLKIYKKDDHKTEANITAWCLAQEG